jgi:hypothetical protein
MIKLKEPPQEAIRDPSQPGSRELRIAQAAWLAVAYADIFDYPLTPAEIHRNLVCTSASRAEVENALFSSKMNSVFLQEIHGFYTLPGREHILSTRRRRSEIATTMWPQAIYFGRVLSSLPYVRLVAITGALAVNNVEPGADIDYLVVTQSGRVWLCRAISMLVVRWAAMKGVVICPNYFIAEDALRHERENIYTAHELTQMIPLSGMSTYLRMRFLNQWTNDFLPNAWNPPAGIEVHPPIEDISRLKKTTEQALNLPFGERLELWEMKRKTARFNNYGVIADEAAFCRDWCKGHLNGHQQHTLAAFSQRQQSMPTELLDFELP